MEEVTQKTERYIDSLPAKGIEKAIRKLIESLMAFDETGVWGKGFIAFYTVHIKILSRVMAAELRYGHEWQQMMDVMHALDNYTKSLKALRFHIPKPGPEKKELVLRLIEIIDGELRGNIRIFEITRKKVKEINTFLGHDKPYNLFDWLLGYQRSTTARNDVCTAVSQFCDESDKLVRLRNAWAEQVPVPKLRLNFRIKMSESCPDTLF